MNRLFLNAGGSRSLMNGIKTVLLIIENVIKFNNIEILV